MSDLGELLLNNIVILPERRLVNIVSTDPRITEQAKPPMEAAAAGYLQTIRSTCPESKDCEAVLDRFEQDVPEAHVTVLSIGVICSKACVQCPMNVREKL